MMMPTMAGPRRAQVLPEKKRRARVNRRKMQQEETECDLQVGGHHPFLLRFTRQ